VTSTASRLRFGALLVAGALSVHELRYALAFGRDAERAAAEQGHAYLSVLVPAVAVVVSLGAVHLLLALAGRRRVEAMAPSFSRLWVLASVALTGAYATQELIEGTLATGHAAGFAGVMGHGGWLAFVLALAVGALIALALRGAAAAPCRARGSTWLGWRCPLDPPVGLPPWRREIVDAFARHLAGREPPAASV
jgi:hypothetical protein